VKLWTQIKAGAIQYVLVISIIIMIVLFAFISLVFLQNKMQLKSERYKKTIQNVYAGFDYLKNHEIPYDTPIQVKFSEATSETTTILKRHWGFLDVAVVTSESRNERTEKVGFLGMHREDRKAIYLQENNQPLVVVGNTKIVGDVVFPKRGVKPGNIAGVSYYGNQLVYGGIEKTANQLPQIQNIDYVRRLIQEVPQENVQFLNFEENMMLNHSFTEETYLFETPYNLSLENVELRGNIILVSESEIRVSQSAKLNDLIVIAPKIYIEAGFEGSGQFIASDQIEIGRNVKLHYPSVVSVVENSDPKENEERIKIASESEIGGMIIYHDERKENNYSTHVNIAENTTISGEVYCNKNLEIAGSVQGFVYANNFITRQSGGVYINHLYHTTIDSEAISEKYVGLPIGTGEQRVAKWIQ
jgi:hypothetical protein